MILLQLCCVVYRYALMDWYRSEEVQVSITWQFYTLIVTYRT